MKTWHRASVPTTCGSCGTIVPTGDPLLALAHRPAGWTKLRCRACAGEPVPTRVEAGPLRPVGESVKFALMTRVTDLAQGYRRDVKRAQGGEEA